MRYLHTLDTDQLREMEEMRKRDEEDKEMENETNN